MVCPGSNELAVLGDGCHSNTDVIGAFCALIIQRDQQLFSMVYCFYIKVNLFCSEIDTESKNVIDMIPLLHTTQRDIINNVHYCLFPLFW